jgi:DNA-binding SARP family transcriptional activator
VERDGAPLDTNHWPRAVQTLFKLLLIAPRHEYRREAAIDLLWPESSPEAGAGSMRHALHVLRQQLGGGDPSLVISQHGWLRLHPDYRWDIDIDRFETLASAAGDDVEEIESALSLYIGEPLVENRYDDWATPPRERAQRTWRDLALRLAGLYRNLGRPQQGLTWCERVVEADPLDEQAVQAMLQILDDLGKRTGFTGDSRTVSTTRWDLSPRIQPNAS